MFPLSTDFEAKVTMENQPDFANEEMPFRMLICGDWSGRESRSESLETPKYRAFEIDRDNFDEIMRRLSVNLLLTFDDSGENSLLLEIAEIDDFHPDQIFQKLPVFANLRDVRRKLLNSNTFDEAAREVNSWLTADNSEQSIKQSIEAESKSPAVPLNDQSSEDLLAQILGKTEQNDSSLSSQTAHKSELSEFVNQLVKPHIVQTDVSEQSKLLLIVDEVTSDLMRKILHHPQFRALESAWRGLYFLVRRVETDTNLKIYIMDISKSEVSNDLKSSEDLFAASLFEMIKSGVSGNYSDNEPWTIIGGNFSFSANVEDVALLMRMGKIVADSNAAFVSQLDENTTKRFIAKGLEGFESSNESKLWAALRTVSESNFLGLLSPRFLVRLPYGEQTDPTESFSFEELSDFDQRESYLWANPVFVCLLMFAQTFSQNGWDVSTNFISEINNLPIHFYEEDGEAKNISCTEIPFNEKNCEQLLTAGIMTLVSFRSSDKIRLLRLQSVAEPLATLNGRWD